MHRGLDRRRAVLVVENQEVVAGQAGDLGDRRLTELQPDAVRRLTGCDGLLQVIGAKHIPYLLRDADEAKHGRRGAAMPPCGADRRRPLATKPSSTCCPTGRQRQEISLLTRNIKEQLKTTKKKR